MGPMHPIYGYWDVGDVGCWAIETLSGGEWVTVHNKVASILCQIARQENQSIRYKSGAETDPRISLKNAYTHLF